MDSGGPPSRQNTTSDLETSGYQPYLALVAGWLVVLLVSCVPVVTMATNDKVIASASAEAVATSVQDGGAVVPAEPGTVITPVSGGEVVVPAPVSVSNLTDRLEARLTKLDRIADGVHSSWPSTPDLVQPEQVTQVKHVIRAVLPDLPPLADGSLKASACILPDPACFHRQQPGQGNAKGCHA